MSRAHGPWRIESQVLKYANPFVEVVEDQVTRPDGQPGTYATVTAKPGVSIVAVGSDGEVHLARQFRYALGRDTIEVATGAVEAGEDPAEAARRELREELGIQAAEWTHLGRIDLEGSVIRCPVDLFLARGLTRTAKDQDPTEDIRRLQVPLDAAIRMVMESEITHAPSCAALLKAMRHIAG